MRLGSAALLVAACTFALAAPAVAIIGGSAASAGEYPWMAALYSGTDPRNQFCGGSLVAPTVVVTAAHCFSLTGDGSLAAIDEQIAPGSVPVVGTSVLLGKNTLAGTGGERIPVARAHIHPQYNSNGQTDHDVAILELARPSIQTPIVWAKPGDEARYAAGVTATIIGWGVTESGSGSNALLEATVPMVSDASCDNAYDGDVHVETQICAGYLGQGGVDTCQGDSGGPLMVPKQGGGFLLAGLTSWGNGCAEPDFPGVYTEVVAISAFIDQWA